MTRFVLLLLAAALATSATAPESVPGPLQTDADKYKVLFENERVRLLEYRDTPGAKTTPHQHPDSLLYYLEPSKRRMTYRDGRELVADRKAGDVIWLPAITHSGENIGTTNSRLLVIELKEPPKSGK